MNNNYINNNHINGLNNINNKDFYNNGYNHNITNNKKFQKQNNYNNRYQLINNQNNNNKNNYNNDINNKNLSNNNFSINYNKRKRKESNSFIDNNKNNININNNNQHPKHYLLFLNLKLGNNQEEIIKIKSIDDCSIVLKKLKENKNVNEKALKLIQNKIYETIEITKKIFNFSLDKYTHKNLAEINNKLTYNKEGRKEKKMQKNMSSKQVNKYFEEDIILSKNDIKKIELLNITF